MPSDGVNEVLAGLLPWSVEQGEAIEWLKSLPDSCVDLVVGSPYYHGKENRYKDLPKQKKRQTLSEWVSFMYKVTWEARRVCKGDVLWVVNNPFKKGYQPAVEGLVWEWYQQGEKLERPLIWHKNAPPNRSDWFSNDWEFILCFPGEGKRKTWNWESIGTAPKFKSGGDFCQRDSKGERKKGGKYPKNKITRPRDVIRCPVGGGMLGHELAHKNEAPFPVKLIEPLVKALSNPGDVVIDPFTGSGGTAQAAVEQGRRFVGCDLRQSQVDLCRERMASVCESRSQAV